LAVFFGRSNKAGERLSVSWPVFFGRRPSVTVAWGKRNVSPGGERTRVVYWLKAKFKNVLI
jgi:hypothetical protein